MTVTESEMTASQIEAVTSLNDAMKGFVLAVKNCKDSDMPLVDAFAMIGVEVPKMVQPAVNALVNKLPAFDSESEDSVKPEE